MIRGFRLAAIAVVMSLSAAVCSCSSARNSSSNGGRDVPSGTVSENISDLTVTFFDVGKADSIVITGEGGTVVIDCGEKGDGKDIVKFLENQGINTIDYLIITHYDKDHVGGAAKVINNLEVLNVLGPDYHEYSDEAKKFRDAMKDNLIEPQLVTSDIEFELGGAQYKIFAPEQTYYGPDDDNDFSLVTRLDYLNTSFIFAGDAMDQRLTEIMDIGDCDLLKIPYHGRKLANLSGFLDEVTPEYAVVCTSSDEFSSYTQGTLMDKGIKFWSTCFNGRITASSDGDEITVTCEKGEV